MRAFAFILMYVTIVGLTIPQLPGWAQEPAKEWMLDIHQFSEHIEDDGSFIDNAPEDNSKDNQANNNGNGGGDGESMPVLVGPVPWSGYLGFNGIPNGFPLWGAIHHPWEVISIHISSGANSTMEGEVVWAGYAKGGWGRLVVIENGEYQIWMAHLSEIQVEVGHVRRIPV